MYVCMYVHNKNQKKSNFSAKIMNLGQLNENQYKCMENPASFCIVSVYLAFLQVVLAMETRVLVFTRFESLNQMLVYHNNNDFIYESYESLYV